MNPDLFKFVMCTLISRNYVLFPMYITRHVYPGNQGTHDLTRSVNSRFNKSIELLMVLLGKGVGKYFNLTFLSTINRNHTSTHTPTYIHIHIHIH